MYIYYVFASTVRQRVSASAGGEDGLSEDVVAAAGSAMERTLRCPASLTYKKKA